MSNPADNSTFYTLKTNIWLCPQRCYRMSKRTTRYVACTAFNMTIHWLCGRLHCNNCWYYFKWSELYSFSAFSGILRLENSL